MRYEPATDPPTARGCQSGTLALGRAIRTTFPELATLTPVYGCYNRRKIAGSASWSIHAEGRALDVGVEAELRSVGWDLACELVLHRVLYGVQRVIWDRHIWSVERIDQWQPLQVRTNQHLDHLHVEQYRSAAARPVTSEQALTESLAKSRRGRG